MTKVSKLFGKDVEPACRYCRLSKPAQDKVMLLCRNYGPVAPDYHCKKYAYDPLKRIPKRPPALPKFDPEDFEL